METSISPYFERNFCEYLIDEYTDSLNQNEKSDFYNVNEQFFEKIINLSQKNSSSASAIKESYIIKIEIKSYRNIITQKMNKNLKKSASSNKRIKIDKNFLNEIISRKNDILKDIRKEKYSEYNFEYKTLYLIKLVLIYKAFINKSKFVCF